MRYLTVIIFFLISDSFVVSAQSNKKKAPTVKESVGDLKESLKAVGDLFKKRDRKATEQKSATDSGNISVSKTTVGDMKPEIPVTATDSTFSASIKEMIIAEFIRKYTKDKPKVAKTEDATYLDMQFDFGGGMRNSAYFSKLKRENVSGDLNSDGKEDAIVKVYSNTGGNSDYLDLYVFIQQDGGAWKLALIKSSSDEDIKGCKIGQFVPTEILSNNLIGESSCFLASDPRCCPSLFYKTTLKFANNQFIVVKKEKIVKKN